MMAAMMAGFFLLGLLSERLYHVRKVSPVTVGVSAMSVFIVLQLLMALGWTAQPMLLMTAFSFFATAGILPYAGLSQIFPKDLSGRVSTSLNLTVFLGAFAVQWGLGEIINLWHSEGKGYAPESYGAAFGSLAVLQLFGLLWFIALNAMKHKAN